MRDSGPGILSSTRNRRAAKRGSFLVANDVRPKGFPSLLCEVAKTKTNNSAGTLIRIARRDFRVRDNGKTGPSGTRIRMIRRDFRV